MQPEKFKCRTQGCWVPDVCLSLRTFLLSLALQVIPDLANCCKGQQQAMGSPGVLISTSPWLQWLMHALLAKLYRSLPNMVFQKSVLWSFETKTESSAADPGGKENNGFIKSAELAT